MTEIRLRNILGFSLIISHFLLLLLVLFLFFRDLFLFDEMTTTIGLVAPMFAGYTTVIIKYYIAHADETRDNGTIKNSTYVLVSFFIPSLFVLCLYIITIMKALNRGFAGFEQYKITMGLIETAFAVYVGQIITAWFQFSPSEENSSGGGEAG